MTYIEPNIKIYDNYTDFKENKGPIRYNFILDDKKKKTIDILKYNRLMILAEPGFGKSVLLKHFVSISEAQGIQSISLYLKSLDINKSLQDNIKHKSKFYHIDKTKSFELSNDSNTLVCLDAFDEVSINDCSSIIDKITEFSSEYPHIKLFITCRSLHFQKYANQFGNISFKFLNIECFYYKDIYKYLEENHFDQQTVAAIERIFPFQGSSNSIINTPRYLELLVRYIKEKGTNCLSTITLSELFDYFIFSKLQKEKENLENNPNETAVIVSIEAMKRVLEKLALVMEIYQVNELSKNDLVSFFDDVKSDLKNQLLYHISIDKFISKSAIKNNVDYIEFENTEFQEYLAAKELSRFDNLKRIVYDIVVDKDLKEIYPSWFSVLSYLMEQKIDLLEYILEFGLKNDKTVTEGYFSLLTKVNANLFSIQSKDKVFKFIFDYHHNNKFLLEYSLSEKLTHYITPKGNEILKKEFKKSMSDKKIEFIRIRNILYLVYNLALNEKLCKNDINFWKTGFVKFLDSKSIDNSHKRQLVFFIQYFYDDNIEKELKNLSFYEDNDFLMSLIHYLSLVANNSDFMTELIIEGLRNDRSSVNRYFFGITSFPHIKKLYSVLNSNVYLIDNLYRNFSFNDNKELLQNYFDNVKCNLDTDLLLQLKIFIINSCSQEVHYTHNSELLSLFIDFVSSLDRNFIFELIDTFSVTKDFRNFNLKDIFISCLFVTQIDDFVKLINDKLSEYNWITFETLFCAQYSNRKEAPELFNKCKEYFPRDYEERLIQDSMNKIEDEKRIMKDYIFFQTLLQTSTEKEYYPDMFSSYIWHKEIIDENITEIERIEFSKYVLIYLSSFNPLTSGLIITKNDISGTSYRVNSYINEYGDAIICANILNLDIQKFRQNIINYIPFAYQNHLDAIMNLTVKISTEEIKPLIEMYLRKDDDLWTFMPNNFIKVIKEVGLYIPEIETILKDYLFIENNKRINDAYRFEALLILDSYKKDVAYIKKLYAYFIKQNNKYLSTKINELLIYNYNDDASIKWRMNHIISGAFSFSQIYEVHSISSQEDELRSKYFAAPLLKVNDTKFLNEYLSFFEKSFKIQAKGKDYWEYANYVREIVFAYFSNLKVYKDIKYLNNIEDLVKNYFSDRNYGHLLYRISLLKKEYLEYIGKPTNVNSCIQIYNRLKNEQYISINNSEQLYDYLKDIIRVDLNNWVTGEGKKLIDEYKSSKHNKETHIQKLIKMQFENILLKKGFKNNDFSIYREVQSLDDKRVDFLIGFGFIPPVLIELKLTSNTDLIGNDLKKKKSFGNLQRYKDNHNVEYTIFLVYDVKGRKPVLFSNHLNKINLAYSKLKNVEVIGIPIV